jgi:integrase
MAYRQIRYFIEKAGARGAGPRFYWQPAKSLEAAGWRTVRLPADRAAAELEAARLNEALDQSRGETIGEATPARAGTIAEVVRLYYASPRFKERRASTKRGYRQMIKLIESAMGDTDARAITAEHVEKFYAAMVKNHGRATGNGAVRVLRLLLEFALKKKMIAFNPALRPGLITPRPSGRLWEPDAVAAFVAMADLLGWHSMGTAVLVNVWLGQREGDIITMPLTAYRGGAIAIDQSKGRERGTRVELPIAGVPALVQRLDAELAHRAARKPKATTLLVCERTGRPWKEDFFRHTFADIRLAAAAAYPHIPELGKLVYMHLRHTAVTRLAEANCEDAMISAITGHTMAHIKTILERYLVRTRKMAALGFARRMESEAAEAAAGKA